MKVERSTAVRATARRSQTSAPSNVPVSVSNQQPQPPQQQQQQQIGQLQPQQQLAVPDLSSLNPTPPQFIIPSGQLGYQQAPGQPTGQLMQTSSGQILQMSMSEMSHAVSSQRLIRRGHQMELMAQAKVLYDQQDFVDLTIYCEDGVVRAHQMLLAVASPFLFSLFQTNPCYGTEDITLILPEVKACLVQALIHFVYTGVVVSGEDHFYSIMKLVYALNINASIEAESTNDRATTFTAPLVPPHLLGTVMKLPHMQHQQTLNSSFTNWSTTGTAAPNFQPLLPQQPVPMSINGGSSNVNGVAAAAVAAITQPAIAPPSLTGQPGGQGQAGPPSAKMPRLSGPPADAMPVPLGSLGGQLGSVVTSSATGNELPIQLPAQPVPVVNGVVRGTEHSQIITSSVGSVLMGANQMTLTQSQAGTSQQQQQVTTVGAGAPGAAASAQPPTQQYIAIDPATGINYKVDMALTSELGSGPLAAIMNETIFQDTSGAIVPAPNAQIYQTDSGQVIYTTQPPPNATAIQTNLAIQQQQQQQLQQQQQQQQPPQPLGTSTPVSAGKKGKKRGAKDAGLNNNSPLGGGGAGGNTSAAASANSTAASILSLSAPGGASTTPGGVAGGGGGGANESVDDLPCTPDDEDINTPYPCPSCNKTIKGKVMLQAHHFQEHFENQELNAMDVGDKHACRVCLKLFTRNSDVKAHILRVHCGDRRYPCTMCGKRFKESTHLRKHLYTHTGERPHYCALCSKGFQTSSDLKRHKRTRVHQERVEQGGGIEPDDVIVSTGGAPPPSTSGTVVVNASGAVVSMAAAGPSPVTAKKSNGAITVVTAGPPSVGGPAGDLSGTRWSEEDDDHLAAGVQHAGQQPSTAQALLSGITEPVPVSTGQLIVPTTSGTNAARENDLIISTTAAGTFTSGGGIVTSGAIDLKDIGAFMPEGGVADAMGGHMPALLEQQLVGSSQPVALVAGKANASAAASNAAAAADEEGEARLTVVEAPDDSSRQEGGLPLLTNNKS